MRLVEIGSQNYTKVFAGERGFGGASHQYYLCRAEDQDNKPAGEFGSVFFQNGAIKESGVNGCQNEDLLAIVLDRLSAFQNSEFKCRENALAITKLEEALHCLNHRTAERKKRGVEGVLVP